ncbi:MAG: archease [Calditrichaeota bacterium]|nr:archease [Calditrichota bacterium]MCB0307413.1 archease [Calditrichota bacterium]MCB9087736.1 archease [Calditrichia bacterium]
MYKILSHTADIALEVWAESLPGLFQEAARGFHDLLLEDAPIRAEQRRQIELSSDEPEDLLVQWLSELNYFVTVHAWLWGAVEDFTLAAENGIWRLKAAVSGEALDAQRHYLYFDIKAVTYHQLEITDTPDGCQTRIVFDI